MDVSLNTYTVDIIFNDIHLGRLKGHYTRFVAESTVTSYMLYILLG